MILKKLYQELITPDDKRLLDLAFSKNPSQKDLDEFLKVWDIEVMGAQKALMLSYFMKMHPELEFYTYNKPRLEGILKYFRFKNLKLISNFKKIGKELNSAKIPFIIIKGGAMKHLRPELSRVMGDIDILVPHKNFFASAEIAKKLGYCFIEKDLHNAHSIDLHRNDPEEGTIDIHRYIYMESKNEKDFNSELFARASKNKVFGTEALVPTNEDILFVALINLSRNLKANTSCDGILFNLFDCKFLIENKPDFNWDIVIKNSEKTKTQNQLKFAIDFISGIIPDLFPDEIQKLFSPDKKMYEYCKIFLFERFYLQEFRNKSIALNILDSIKSIKGTKKYLLAKSKHHILKYIKRNTFLETIFVNLAERVLFEYANT